MTAVGNRRATTTLYSDSDSIRSHWVRLAMAEKNIAVHTHFVDPDNPPDELIAVNPQAELPTLVDRDLTLYGSKVIVDYLDERYPHPPFMPIDPVSRARTRLALYRIERDWYSLIPIDPDSGSLDKHLSQRLDQSLSEASEVFSMMPYFFSEEYSILDVALAPLLWRLGLYGIVLTEQSAPIRSYADRIFARQGFQESLSDAERNMPQ